jgi:hypothetical protein
MKTLFSLLNLVFGILFLLIGLGAFLTVSKTPVNIAIGIVPVAAGFVCLWLCRESAASRQARMP